MILQIAGAIFVSTTAMAILEPCLPIWLMANLNPEVHSFAQSIFLEANSISYSSPFMTIILLRFFSIHFQKWQIGTVFIPDSIGYFISTNFFAIIAHRFGQVRTAVISLAIVGVSCLLVSSLTNNYIKKKSVNGTYAKLLFRTDSSCEFSGISITSSFSAWHRNWDP